MGSRIVSPAGYRPRGGARGALAGETAPGLLPICATKKIRNDQNYYEQIEGYLMKNADVKFSHGICPECFKKFAEPELNA